MNLGQTYRWNLPNLPRRHLWVIITDPRKNPDQVLVVNFSTRKAGSDLTCVIKETEFPGALDHESFINYIRSEVHSLASLQKNSQEGLITLEPFAPGNVLRKVQRGFLNSKDVQDYKKAILRAQGLPGE